MLRIVPRAPLSAHVTLQQRLLPAATRGVATPRSNDGSRRGLSNLVSSPSPRIRWVDFEPPTGMLNVRKVLAPEESPRGKRSLHSARSDPAQSIALGCSAGKDAAVDGQNDPNQAAKAGLDAPAAELASDLAEDPLPPLDAAAEFMRDLTDNDLLGQLYSPATQTAKEPTENSPSSVDELSDEEAFGRHFSNTRGDLTVDRSDHRESVTRPAPQFDAPSSFVGRCSEPGEQEKVTGSSPFKLTRGVSSQPARLKISNLPDNITGSMLLNAISIHGPFGKVLGAKVRNVPGNAFALIDFVSKTTARSLLTFIREGNLTIEGRVVTCRWHPCEYGPEYTSWRSRVLVVAMKQDLANYSFLGRLRTISKGEARHPDVIIEPILTVDGWVALVCTFLDQQRASHARHNLRLDGVRVSFGEDPVAVGIVQAYEANVRFGERLIVGIFQSNGLIEDRGYPKSIVEQAEERLEQQIKPPRPPASPAKNISNPSSSPVLPMGHRSQPRPPPEEDVSLDPFVAMSQATHRPDAKQAIRNNSISFADELGQWERWEDDEPGYLDEPRFPTSATAVSRSSESPTTEQRLGVERLSGPDGARGPQSDAETTDTLEDIGKVLERFRKGL